MKEPDFPHNEVERLKALRQLDILDTTEEETFDAITKAAQIGTNSAIALVTLVDETRQWFKSKQGLVETETPRGVSFCAHAINSRDDFVVENSEEDERFHDNPLVNEPPFVKSYLGVPITTSDGLALGTLCVIDHSPKPWSLKDRSLVRNLANAVSELIEIRKRAIEADRLASELAFLSERILSGASMYQSVEKIANIGGWRLSLDDLHFEWTAQTQRIHEVDGNYQPTLRKALEFFSKKDAECLKLAIADSVERGDDWDLEAQITTAKGNIRHVRVIGRAVLKEGVPYKLAGAIQDITSDVRDREKRKLASEIQSLHVDLQGRFMKGGSKSAFEASLEGLLNLTGSEYGFVGEVLYEDSVPYLKTRAITDISWNKETKRFYEKNAPSGMEFRNLETLFGAAIKEQQAAIVNNPQTHPSRGGLPEGHPDLNCFLGIPVFAADSLVGLVGLANRATGYDAELLQNLSSTTELIGQMISLVRERERRTASERALREAKVMAETLASKLQLATQAASIGIWELDGSGVSLKWDETMHQLYGMDRAAPPSKLEEWQRLVHPDDLETTVSVLGRLQSGETDSVATRFRIVRPDGKVRHIFGNAARVVSQSSTVQYIGTNIDVTEFVESLERAEAAATSKAAFLANMSHEIRTPLNGVLGMASVLSTMNLSEEQLTLVDVIKSSGDSLNALLNDILDMSKIDAGKAELSYREFSLVEDIRSALKPMKIRAEEKGLALYLETAELEGTKFLGDNIRIRQITTNLVSNAIKFTEAGHVRILMEPLSAGSDNAEQGGVRIVVTDTGCGISEDDLPRLFNRFEQVDNSMTRAHTGSGLGLAISKALVEMMEGSISVDSKVGEGSTFAVELPLIYAPDQSDCLASGAEEEKAGSTRQDCCLFSGCSVLVVEDHPVNRRVMKLVLEKTGATIAFANDGEKALEAVRSKEFDLIFMDAQMPKLDGYEATAKIRQLELENKSKHTPVVMVSASAMTHDIERALDSGCDAHIAKPITPGELLMTMEKILNPS